MGATMSAFIPSYTKSPITSKIFSLELFSKASSDEPLHHVYRDALAGLFTPFGNIGGI